MNFSNEARLAHGAAANGSPTFGLPLVSVIIVNYNYGRFLRQTVDSVFAQNYPNIECIIVDNASTDDSSEIIADLAKLYPDITILRRADNAGLCIAATEGFESSTGEYVIFLDADDALLDSCVETHIFVHMSLRIAVGVTSADMIQVAETRVVLGTYLNQTEFMRSGKGVKPDLLRRIDESAPELWPLPGPDAALASEVRFVEPMDANWAWSPTSANCFRRDAVKLFLNKKSLGDLLGCLDSYLLRGISVLTGSVLIDRPLVFYRIHGSNIFSKHPTLNGVVNFERGGKYDEEQHCREMLIDHMIANASSFLRLLPSIDYYMGALGALNDSWPRLCPSGVPCESYLATKIMAEFDTFAGLIGVAETQSWLARLGFSQRSLTFAKLRFRVGNALSRAKKAD
jgi:glycosyltransferase involved in cell wall biosynthesis